LDETADAQMDIDDDAEMYRSPGRDEKRIWVAEAWFRGLRMA